MVAVKNSETEYRLSTLEEAATWHLTPVNNAFLQAVIFPNSSKFSKFQLPLISGLPFDPVHVRQT